jgi:hypothetical protein
LRLAERVLAGEAVGLSQLDADERRAVLLVARELGRGLHDAPTAPRGRDSEHVTLVPAPVEEVDR